MNGKHQAETPCPSGIFWIVEEGDTFYLISRRLNIDLKKLMAANPGINPQNLKIGSRICIPK